MNRYIKRKLANYLSFFLVFSGILQAWITLSRHLSKGDAIILNYHRVCDIETGIFLFYDKNVSCSTAMFEGQMTYLKSKFNIISLGQYVQARRNGYAIQPPTVIITFDDGYKDVYKYAFPVLQKFQIPATIFLTTDYVGGSKLFWWDEIALYVKKTTEKSVDIKEIGKLDLETLDAKRKAAEAIVDKLTHMDEAKRQLVTDQLAEKLKLEKYDEKESSSFVTWDNIREMYKNSVEIEGHTVTHPNLRKLDNDMLMKELTASKQRIEMALGNTVSLFAYPYGHKEHFDKRVIDALKAAGYSCACTTIYGSAKDSDDLFMLKRIPLFHYNSFNLFKAKVSGIFNSFEK